jgi:phosphohistidine swiveling domain-containing protein
MAHASFIELFDCKAPDAARLGGKGASLCRLVHDGNLVPAGFILTVDAFERTCEALELGARLASIEQALLGEGDLSRTGDDICERLLTGHLPADIVEPLLDIVGRLGLWNDNPAGVIVRSSATVEDSAAHSFAGIFESIVITTPASLEPTVRAVWASVFSPRALAYYREIGLTKVPTMAIVIQRFVAAERSGVMFTTFGGRTLVEHVEGDCEKLVKGEVTPEQLWLSGPEREPETSGSLDPAHVKELARLAKALEAQFGGPQDVEWVLLDGQIQVVQSRPITTSGKQTDGPDDLPTGIGDATPILAGTGASGGWGAGDVHLAFNIEDALALSTGQVLVTPMTNPDMVVAMRRSAAIVTDVGGMICHAAIVSRELGLPCVVGTAKATTTVRNGEVVTVSGSAGVVYRGALDFTTQTEKRRPASWFDLWSRWTTATAPHSNVVPIVSTIEAFEDMPAHHAVVVVVPDIDLRTGPTGLWADIEGMADAESNALLDGYLARLANVARRKRIERLYVQPRGKWPKERISARLKHPGYDTLRLHDGDSDAPPLVLDPRSSEGLSGVAIPLAAVAALGLMPTVSAAPTTVPQVSGMEEARAAALDTIKFFGHEPGSHRSSMPRPAWRGGWWTLLPEYGRFHQEHGTAGEQGEFTWLEVRPELVISPLLKSLVQPGFEMVPRVMGFRDLPPMHIKWMRCRYHFRSDTFATVWRAIVAATWSEEYMADLMRRVRASYVHLADVLVLFPKSSAERAGLSPLQIDALITSWWPRWVEFFALCWFIQAQGDDILYPFIDETVKDNLRRAEHSATDFAWPGAPDLVAPTTPVLSGEYMADVTDLRQTLLAAGLVTREQALEALERGDSPEVGRRLAEHLSKWHWMRDRDLLFEPWDTPARVIETALRTDPHVPAPYEANMRRQMLALGVHFDLAHASGRADGMHHAVRFLHDLNVERENHHVLWLKFSYPLRALVLEVERRLVAVGSLRPGDIFFMQAPEVIAAARSLPAPLSPGLVTTVRNRRRAFLHEARLEPTDQSELVREDDYY